MCKPLTSKSRNSLYTRLVASYASAAVCTVSLFRVSLLSSLLYQSSFANISGTEMKECPTNVSRSVLLLWDDSFALRNSTCYLTLPERNLFTPTLGNGAYRGKIFGFPRLRLVAVMTTSLKGSEEWCGFCPTLQPGRNENLARTSSSSRSGSIDVRRCINQRSATTSFHPLSWLAASEPTGLNRHLANISRFAAIGWTHAQLSVMLDGSCANHDLYFLHANQPALSVCGQTANVLFLDESIRPLYFILFAQDRVLSRWLPLPDEYACSDGSNYELVVSVASGRVAIEIDIAMGPASSSCRVLCVADECDLDFKSKKKINYEITVNRSLTVKYMFHSAALPCDSQVYSRFSSRIRWPEPQRLLVVTKYEPYRPFRVAEVSVNNTTDEKNSQASPETTVPSSAESGFITIAASAVAALTVFAASVFVARWILWRTRRQSVVNFKRNGAAAATNNDRGKSSDASCYAILRFMENCSRVSSAGQFYRSAAATTASAPQAGRSAEPAQLQQHTSEQYAERGEVSPPSSHNRLLSTITLHDVLIESRKGSSVDNSSRSALPLEAEPSAQFPLASARSLDVSFDEHIYSEVDGPDARYMHTMTSNGNSLYSGLL